MTQLDVYTEEKFEDEEEMRERASRRFHVDDQHNTSEIFSAFEDLVALTRSSAEDYDMVVRIIRALIPLFQCQSERYGSRQHRSISNNFTLRTSLPSVVATFVEQANSITDLCGDTLYLRVTANIKLDRGAGQHS